MDSIRPITPSPTRNHHYLDSLQADTLRKTRFFSAIDSNNAESPASRKLLKDIYKDQNITERTGRFWRKQRQLQGTPQAYRRDNRARIGCPFKLSDEALDALGDFSGGSSYTY